MSSSYVATGNKPISLSSDSNEENNPGKKLPSISVNLQDKWARSEERDTNWTQSDLSNAIIRYRKFLYLAKKYPNMTLAPTKDIDAIWHLHMLSPVAYFKDCISFLGTIFDHDGGYGKTDNELASLKDVFTQTQTMWKNEFNEEYVLHDKTSSTNCWHDCQGRCWHACSSKLNVEIVH